MAAIIITFQDLAGIEADAADIKSLNIDVVINALLPSSVWTDGPTQLSVLSAFCGDMLDAYEDAGLMGMLWIGPLSQRSDPKLSDITTLVNTWKDHPALYGWYTADEPTTAITVPAFENVYDTIKAADPDHPIYIIYPGYGSSFYPGGSPTAYPFPSSRTMYDFFGVDNYHTGSTYTSEMTACYGSVPTASRGGLINCMGVFNGISGTQFTSDASSAASIGWNTAGIAFWCWEFYTGEFSGLKNNTAAWSAVASAANSYKVSTPTTTTTTTTTATPTTSTTGAPTTSTTVAPTTSTTAAPPPIVEGGHMRLIPTSGGALRAKVGSTIHQITLASPGVNVNRLFTSKGVKGIV